MEATNKKPTTRKPANKKSTTNNNASIGKTIFINTNINFNGTLIKGSSFVNLTNIFYDKNDTKGSYKVMQKKFAETETYNIATEILFDEIEKALKIANKKINKKFEKRDDKLSDEDKYNIKVQFKANIYDGTRETINESDIKM